MKKKSTGAALWIRLAKCYDLMIREVRDLPARSGLTLPQFDAMVQLLRRSDGMPAGELSRALLVTAGNVTGIIARLEERQLIRSTRPQDGRFKVLTLTQRGRRMAQTEVRRHERRLNEIFSGLSPARRAKLRESLDALRRTLEGGEDGHRAQKLSVRA